MNLYESSIEYLSCFRCVLVSVCLRWFGGSGSLASGSQTPNQMHYKLYENILAYCAGQLNMNSQYRYIPWPTVKAIVLMIETEGQQSFRAFFRLSSFKKNKTKKK